MNLPNNPLSRREICVVLFLVGILALFIHSSWKETPKSLEVSTSAIRNASFEEFTFTLQSQIFLGAKALKEQGDITRPSTPLEIGLHEIAGTVVKVEREVLQREGSTLSASPTDPTSRFLLRRKLITLALLGDSSGAMTQAEVLSNDSSRSEMEQQLDQVLLPLLSRLSEGNCQEPLEPLNGELLESQLGWHGRFVSAQINCLNLNELLEPCIGKFKRFATFVTLFVVIIPVALLCLLVYSLHFLRGKALFAFRPSAIPSHYALEIFALYFGIYALFSKVAPDSMEWLIGQGFPLNRLLVNASFIVGLLVLILWPKSGGFTFRQIRETLGLQLGSLKRALADTLISPTFYLASWVLLGVALIIYSLLLQVWGIEVSQGTHPIVPILLSNEDQQTTTLLVILAVVIAPIVEEIMFRGALYSWLRSKLSAPSSIIISALIFAVVHPQGPVGVLPLTIIGCFLAFLREWRGTLLAPMLVHACVNGGTMALLLLLMK